jgi:glutaminyl-peptide cyclotransferase
MAAKLKPAILAGLLLTGCAPKPPPQIQWQSFSGDRAMAQAQKLVGFGPRPSGSEAMAQQANYIAAQLQEFGLDVEEQVFRADTPRGPVQFRNIVGKTRGGRSGPGQVILIGAHYDTKWFTNMTFVGANDGASGAAVLLEIARVAAAQPNLWFVFFDGEECVNEYGPNDGLQGSRHFLEELKRQKQTDWVRAMILLDMVGDAHLDLKMPLNSEMGLIGVVFNAARELGCRDNFSYGNTEILDDHVPFMRAGIGAVDLIDFEYGSAPGLNDYWHTDKDTLDKISPKSLEVAGRTVLRVIAMLEEVQHH